MIKRKYWTEREVALLRQHYATLPTADLVSIIGRTANLINAKANAIGLRKAPEVVAQMARDRMSADHPGRKHQFKPGQVPANKGTKRPKGWAPGKIATSQFKAGQNPHTWLPLGSHVINSDGHLDRKVCDDPGPRHKRWHPVYRLVWEQHHGPVPAGYAVVFKPGQRTNVLEQITIDRLELLSRAELMKRNSLHNLPPTLVAITRLRASISRQITKQSQDTEGTTP